MRNCFGEFDSLFPALPVRNRGIKNRNYSEKDLNS